MNKKRVIYGLFIGALLMVGVWMSSPVQSVAQTPIVLYVRGACKFPLPSGYQVECGDLTVPQNRDLPHGRSIKLHVAYFHSTNPNPPEDPILYLVGGPGVSLLYDIEHLFYHFEVYLANRDVIVFDQRGTGYARPALLCENAHFGIESAEVCGRFYRQWGIDLEAFSSVESAADAEDLRRALGIRAWNVVGVSYGSRLAQVIARDHPQGVRSVILDSVAELDGVDYSRYSSRIEWPRQILRDCEADPPCRAAYPNIVEVFDDVVGRLVRQPVRVQDGEERIWLDVEMFIALTHQHISSHDGARAFPAMIAAAAQGNFAPLLDYEVSYTLFDLMNTAINCNDGLYDWFTCDAYGITVGPPLDEQPINFAMPTLIVNGHWDPLTPTESAKAVWRALPNAVFVEFPYLSHGVVRSGDTCAVSIAFAFLDDPTQPLPLECVSATHPNFVLP